MCCGGYFSEQVQVRSPPLKLLPGVVHVWGMVGPRDYLISKGGREEQLALRGTREAGGTRSGGNGKEKEKKGGGGGERRRGGGTFKMAFELSHT